ncbi:MAG: spermidine/putrescine ABC transporter permease [Verrucomicrobia bacterium]|nr:MAG: spermidine/putrescine ABC transporter permease [Verrucomicrobiota bacterium]
MKRVSLPLWFTAGLLYVFLYAPIVVVIGYSFNTARYGAGWKGFTIRWYRVLWENPHALAAAKNTLILAGLSTLIATVLGTTLGIRLSRYSFPGKKLLSGVMYVPVTIPDIVMAVAMMLFYSVVRQWTGMFELGMTTMVLAHVTFQIPFVAIVVRARLAGLDPSLEEAARDLGANPWRTFWHVTLPLILPGIIAGAMLAFTLSLDDFVVSFFTTGPGATTLPILIYSSVKRGITPDINALSTLIVLVSVFATVCVTCLQRSRANLPNLS